MSAPLASTRIVKDTEGREPTQTHETTITSMTLAVDAPPESSQVPMLARGSSCAGLLVVAQRDNRAWRFVTFSERAPGYRPGADRWRQRAEDR